jgi:DNA-binding response OmpR family regulator
MDPDDPPAVLSERTSAPPLILIVANHKDTRELYALILANHGFSVIETGRPEAALNLAASATPAAIVLDLPMNVSLALVQQLRAHVLTCRLMIFMLTEDIPAGGQAAPRRVHADAECRKPCLPGEFVDRLTAMLIRRRH